MICAARGTIYGSIIFSLFLAEIAPELEVIAVIISPPPVTWTLQRLGHPGAIQVAWIVI